MTDPRLEAAAREYAKAEWEEIDENPFCQDTIKDFKAGWAAREAKGAPVTNERLEAAAREYADKHGERLMMVSPAKAAMIELFLAGAHWQQSQPPSADYTEQARELVTAWGASMNPNFERELMDRIARALSRVAADMQERCANAVTYLDNECCQESALQTRERIRSLPPGPAKLSPEVEALIEAAEELVEIIHDTEARKHVDSFTVRPLAQALEAARKAGK